MFWRRKRDSDPISQALRGEAPEQVAQGAATPAPAAPVQPQRPGDAVPEIESRSPLNAAPQPAVERARIAPKSPRAAIEPERVRAPRSRAAKHPMIVAANAVFTFLVLLSVGAGIVFFAGKNKLDAPGPLTADKVVNIPRAGVRDVADTLEREKVVDQSWMFVIAAMLQKSRGDLKSGEYQFAKRASLQDVLNTIIDGKVVQHALTIPEGLTSEQIVQRLLETDSLAGNIREIPREGSLLPETYRFTRNTPREQMIQRMQQAQRKLLQEAWDRRTPDLPLKSPEELVTLASIVEKETGKPDERARVAAVFVNRLKQRIKLQSDPTIIYGLVGGKGTLGRPILRSEITQPTPYNTYTIPALPPGPIANPGRAAIEATANPARTREIYFVADGTGGHSFSETLDQHRKNVAAYRAIEKQPSNDTSSADDEPTAAAPTAGSKPAARPAKPAVAAPSAAATPTQSLSSPRLRTQPVE